MAEPRLNSDRRQFLKTGLLAAGAAAVGPSLGRAAPKADEIAQTIPARKFGKTGLSLPIFGMGGSAMVRMWIASYGVKLLTTEERVAMVRHAYDRGVRYFDTARVYGESESIM